MALETGAPAISVVIPNYRRPALLRRCLTSVCQATRVAGCEVEVIVVDDGSGDESCAMVRAEFPLARLVVGTVNRGYPAAVNAGVASSTGRWILTLNNDTTVEASVFDELLAVAESAPDVASVAAQQRFGSDASLIYSAGMTIDRRGHASDRMMGRPIGEAERHPVEVFGACGAAALYRRDVLTELGGFDERFVFGLEDADVAWRARMRGWRCLYAPRAVVRHDLGGTIPHGSDLRLFQAGRNRLLLLAKNLDTRQLLRLAPQILLFDIGYVVYGALRLRTLTPLRGRWAGLRLWRAARLSGASGRTAVELAPAVPLRVVLGRRRAWSHAARPLTVPEAAPAWHR